ncbi:MAG: hypothetical protein AAB972_00060, partial [Patescibacteria group bacterium]
MSDDQLIKYVETSSDATTGTDDKEGKTSSDAATGTDAIDTVRIALEGVKEQAAKFDAKLKESKRNITMIKWVMVAIV